MEQKNTLIKICGLTTPEDIRYINEIKPDFAGFVLFFPKSKRNITPAQAEKLTASLSGDIKKVAVVVSPTPEQIRVIEQTDFDYIQIHGILPEERLTEIHLPVIRAFQHEDLDEYAFYQDFPQITGYLFDAAKPGSGKTFDWNTLKNLPRDDKLFFLAGGLHAGNVHEAIKTLQPDVVDVSSGVEYDSRPGKDPEKIKAFVNNARSAYTNNMIKPEKGDS